MEHLYNPASRYTPAPAPPPHEVLKQALCLMVTLKLPGMKRKVSVEQVEAQTDKKLLHVSKTILDSPELKAIESFDGETRAHLDVRKLPCSVIKGGMYLIPVRSFEQVYLWLERRAELREALVEEFLARYPERVEETKLRLDTLAEDTNYPAPNVIRKCFEMNFRAITFDTPTKLKEISMEIVRKEEEKAREQARAVVEEMRDGARELMHGLVGHLVVCLEPDVDGKVKRFHKTTVQKLQEALTLFNDKNIVGDTDLAELVQQAHDLVGGVTTETLKKDGELRISVREGLSMVQGQLASLVEKTSGRRYRLEDLEG